MQVMRIRTTGVQTRAIGMQVMTLMRVMSVQMTRMRATRDGNGHAGDDTHEGNERAGDDTTMGGYDAEEEGDGEQDIDEGMDDLE
jgi:hypothetical protein